MNNKDSRPDILFISGSPRSRTCVALIDLLEQGAKNAGAKTQRFLLSKKRINPCIGCEGCSTTGNCVQTGKSFNGQFTDDYLELKAVIERVDALAIVAPLYFAGPPSQLKALYDRMQPYWVQRYLLGLPMGAKRPAQLFVVGGGADPHGYSPLTGSTKSALAVAGFNLEKVNNFIGFSAPKDIPVFPSDNELEGYKHAELARLKRRIVQQATLVQRATDAGGAFARFVVKKKQADNLAAQLAKLEEEMEALKRAGDVEKTGKNGKTRKPRTSDSADRPIQAVFDSAFSLMDRGVETRKGKLQAGIDLDYSNYMSKTGKEIVDEQDADEQSVDEQNALPDPFASKEKSSEKSDA